MGTLHLPLKSGFCRWRDAGGLAAQRSAGGDRRTEQRSSAMHGRCIRPAAAAIVACTPQPPLGLAARAPASLGASTRRSPALSSTWGWRPWAPPSRRPPRRPSPRASGRLMLAQWAAAAPAARAGVSVGPGSSTAAAASSQPATSSHMRLQQKAAGGSTHRGRPPPEARHPASPPASWHPHQESPCNVVMHRVEVVQAGPASAARRLACTRWSAQERQPRGGPAAARRQPSRPGSHGRVLIPVVGLLSIRVRDPVRAMDMNA